MGDIIGNAVTTEGRRAEQIDREAKEVPEVHPMKMKKVSIKGRKLPWKEVSDTHWPLKGLLHKGMTQNQ